MKGGKGLESKIIEKIQKLLSLSESSNEHEAKLAMLKAQKLLTKYKLSLREVKEYKSYNSIIREKRSNISFRTAKWKAHLAKLIADNFGCYIYYKTRYSHTITFFGREEDVVVCNIVLEYAVDCIDNSIKKLQYQYRRNGLSVRGLANDYAIGFIEGLREQFDEQKKANQEWGIILAKDKEVMEAYEQKEFEGSVDTSIKFKGHDEVYFKGHEDGQKFSITNKITEGTEDTLRTLQSS